MAMIDPEGLMFDFARATQALYDSFEGTPEEKLAQLNAIWEEGREEREAELLGAEELGRIVGGNVERFVETLAADILEKAGTRARVESLLWGTHD